MITDRFEHGVQRDEKDVVRREYQQHFLVGSQGFPRKLDDRVHEQNVRDEAGDCNLCGLSSDPKSHSLTNVGVFDELV